MGLFGIISNTVKAAANTIMVPVDLIKEATGIGDKGDTEKRIEQVEKNVKDAAKDTEETFIGIIVFIFSHLDEVVAIHWFLNNHDQIKQSVSTYNDVIDLNVRQSQMKVKMDSIDKKVNVALKNKAPYDSLILSRNGRTRHIHHKTPWVYR